MGRRSLTRKQILSYEPPLVRWSRKTLEFTQTYYIHILGGLAILLSILFGYYAWQKHKLDVLMKGNAELQKVLNDINTFLASPPLDENKRKSRQNELIQKLADIQHKYNGEAPAYEAAYHEGQLYLYSGHFKKALEAFKKASRYGEPLNILARIGMANSYAGLKNYSEALRILTALENQDSPYLSKDTVLFFKGKWLLKMHKPKEAQQALEMLMKDYSSSPYKEKAQKLLNTIPKKNEPPQNS